MYIHRALQYLCITSSLELSSRFIPTALSFLSRFTSSSTSQLISVIIPTLVIHHSFTLSLQAQTYFFNKSFPPFLYLLDCLTITGLDRTYHAHHFIFSFTFQFFFVYSVWWTKLAIRQLFTARKIHTIVSYRIVSYRTLPCGI